MNFRRLLLTVVLFISARAMGLAQTATLTPNVATLNAAGGQVTLTLAATFTGTAIYDLTVQLPGGWSYVSGTGEPSIRPTAGQTDKLEWAPLSLASNSAAFAFTVAYPVGLTSATITSVFGLRPATGSRLTITPSPVVFGGPPVIATAPTSQIASAGSNVTFSVTATGTAPLAYEWRKDGVAVTGATNAILTLSGITAANAGSYTANVTNAFGSATSAVATLTLTTTPPPPPLVVVPSIAQNPVSRSAVVGASATFTVVADGTAPFTYQWRKNGAAIAGATTASFSIAAVAVTDAGAYTVVVTNSAGSATSAPATLEVTLAPPTATAPTTAAALLVQGPGSPPFVIGASANFSVIHNGTAPFTFQWRKNGAAIAGATAATFALASVAATDAGSYSVVVTNSAGAITSISVNLEVAPPAPPAITTQPAALTAGQGQTATFTVVAAGAGPLTYQWRKNGVVLPSASFATLSLTNLSAADAGSYAVVVTGAGGAVTSGSAALTVRPPSYTGSYFGTFATGGSFALQVRADQTGVFLGYASGSQATFITRDVAVDSAGRFRVSTLATTPSAARVAAATIEYTIEATISPAGALTGAVNGATPLTATRSAATGVSQAVAGFYQAGAANSSATSYAIVSPAGQAFVLTVTPSTTDAGTGTVDAAGRVAVTTAAKATFAGTLGAAAATLTATVTTATGVKLDFLGASDTRVATEKLLNIATRGAVGGSAGEMIAGFVLRGDAPKAVMIRAIGPGLGSFGVAGVLAAPRLELFRGSTSLLLNNGWGSSTDIAAAAARVGAFALTPNSKDAVLFVSLPPGAYTAVVSGNDGTAGVALVEVYDVSENSPPTQKVVNIASRGFAGSGDTTLTAGFVISGAVPKRVLIRGVGPALSGFGVPGTLVDPQLKLFDQPGAIIATNDDWGTPVTAAAADAAQIATTANAVGAFAFAPGSKDSALLLNLAPGPYTVQLSGAGTTTGAALVEVYEVP